ncbi:MAG: zinc ribbon domain-containing protein [Verrucomicrobiota bacterium]
MPIYVYRILKDDGSEGETFEVEQPMSAPALEKHPVSGERVERVYLPPNLTTKYTPGGTQKKLSNENVEKAGFTKYERDKLTGSYHKVAGKDSQAPETLNP